MTLRVAVLYGGVSEEHEVSVVSARGVLAAIDRSKYEVLPVAVTKSGLWLLPDQSPEGIYLQPGKMPAVDGSEGRPLTLRRGGELEGAGLPGPVDVVFPVLHGKGGEDGAIQGMLESLGVPYVGAGVAASAVGMDKSLQKPVFAAAGIPVTPWSRVRRHDFVRDPGGVARGARAAVGLPCFVKPARLGSSVGVSKCRTEEELLRGLHAALALDDVALVEESISGRELECAVLGNDDPEASVVGEIVPVNEFYDYEAKYLVDGSELLIPADVSESVAEQVRRWSLTAFTAIGCAGMARADFFLAGDGRVLLNEINTIPGFTPISMYPKLWEASGIPYSKLIDRLIELALDARARRA
ncbi:MAG: D-alanine--D-alanine ligase family protein [Actinomycetota bacterium]